MTDWQLKVLLKRNQDGDPLDLTASPVLSRPYTLSLLGCRMISARTKAALAAAKRRGVKLGGDRGGRLTAKARAAGRAVQRQRARSRALVPTIKELQEVGCTSLRAIAAALEARGVPAARGGKWTAVQVSRLLEVAAIPFFNASAAVAV